MTQVKEDGSLDCGGNGRDHEDWSNFGYFSKVEPMRCVNRFELEYAEPCP